MRQRDFRPAAVAVVALTLRAVGWEPIYNTAKDVLTIGHALVGTDQGPPSAREISRNIEQTQQSLSEIFEAEYGQGLAENNLNAAVIAVAELLDRQHTDDLMLGVVTDSAAFERRILDDGGGGALRRELGSEQAISAFDILLSSVCRHLVQVTLDDPQFLAIALQQLLRSQAEQGRDIKEVKANLPSLSDSRRKEEMFRTFTLKYLTRVTEQLDFLDIPGIDLERHRQRYSLASAYTPVKLRDAMAVETEFASFQSLMEVNPFVLIVGSAGCGKSTLLKWMATHFSRTALAHGLRASKVPFLIKLRYLTKMPSLDDIGVPMTEGIAIEKPPYWSQDLVDSGRAILLFDGLDEVPEHRRETFSRWINDLYEEHGRRGLNIVVTSRDQAVFDVRFRPSLATMATLQTMQESEIEEFLRNWHRTIYGQHDQDQGWIAVSEQLLARLETNRELSRIASNPLMCAVICAMYHESKRQLPGERPELYEALLSMMLSRRDAERPGIEALLPLSDIRLAAEQIAKDYIIRGVSELDRAIVLQVLRKSLRGFQDPKARDLRPGLLLDYLLNRTGVFKEISDPEVIEFWHKSFQEFLAASAFVSNNDDDTLLTHSRAAPWREVLVWACSVMSAERASHLITEIIRSAKGDNEVTDRGYLFGLALACAHYANDLSEEARTEVNRCARQYVPPVSRDQLDAIVDLGEAAIPFLEKALADSIEMHKQRNSILALIRIGGEAAHRALSDTSDEFKERWARLLADGWRSTGSEDYARRVLGTVPQEARRKIPLRVRSPRQLRCIEYPSAVFTPFVELSAGSIDANCLGPGSSRPLRRVVLHNCNWQQVLLFLTRYPVIRDLSVVDPPEGFVSGELAGSFPGVESLTLIASENIAVDLDALSFVPNLSTLVIAGEVSVREGSGFSALPMLNNVVIDVRKESDISIRWSGSLRHLTCFPWPHVSLEPLREMTELRELTVSSAPRLETLSGIESLPNISIVDVSSCHELFSIKDALGSSSLSRLIVAGCDNLTPMPLDYSYSFILDLNDDDLGKRGLGWEPPGLVYDRWRDPRLATISDSELELRGWDDWSFWDEVRQDEDEWDAPDPLTPEESRYLEEGLTIYESMEAWQPAQRDRESPPN